MTWYAVPVKLRLPAQLAGQQPRGLRLPAVAAAKGHVRLGNPGSAAVSPSVIVASGRHHLHWGTSGGGGATASAGALPVLILVLSLSRIHKLPADPCVGITRRRRR